LLYFNKPLVKQLKRRGWSDQKILPVAKSAPLLVVILGTLLVKTLQLDQDRRH
jgi:broad-specificity NMP kinase